MSLRRRVMVVNGEKYTPVTCIRSPNVGDKLGAFIDTGIIMQPDMVMTIHSERFASFGCEFGDDNTGINIVNGNFSNDSCVWGVSFTPYIKANQIHTHKFDAPAGKAYIDNSLELTTPFVQPTISFMLFHTLVGRAYYGGAQCYYLTTEQGGVLTHNLQPHLNAKGEPGMLDLVTGEWHGSANGYTLEYDP